MPGRGGLLLALPCTPAPTQRRGKGSRQRAPRRIPAGPQRAGKKLTGSGKTLPRPEALRSAGSAPPPPPGVGARCRLRRPAGRRQHRAARSQALNEPMALTAPSQQLQSLKAIYTLASSHKAGAPTMLRLHISGQENVSLTGLGESCSPEPLAVPRRWRRREPQPCWQRPGAAARPSARASPDLAFSCWAPRGCVFLFKSPS